MSDEKDLTIYSGSRSGGKTDAQRRRAINFGLMFGMGSPKPKRSIERRKDFEALYLSTPPFTVGKQTIQEKPAMTEMDTKALEVLDKAIDQQTIRVEGLQAAMAYGSGRYFPSISQEETRLLSHEENVLRRMMIARQVIKDNYNTCPGSVVVPKSELHPDFYQDKK